MENPKKRVFQEELENPRFFRRCEGEFSLPTLHKWRDKGFGPQTRKARSNIERLAYVSIEYFHKDRTLDEEAYRLGSLVQ